MPKTTARNSHPRKSNDLQAKTPPTYRCRPGYDQAIVTLDDVFTTDPLDVRDQVDADVLRHR